MTVSAGEICLSVSLSEQEAWDLAQFLKRTGFADFRSNAVDDGEAYPIVTFRSRCQQSLAKLAYYLAIHKLKCHSR